MPSDPITYQRAAIMRRNLTPPEARLWARLKGGRLHGPYILDFYCTVARMGVEGDGSIHETPDRLAHDRRRTAWLAAQGIELLRYPALAIRDNLDGVLAGIRDAVIGR